MKLKLIHIAALTTLVSASAPTAAQPRQPDAEAVAKQFAKADKNSDGKLTLDEAKAGMPRVARRFDTLDKDKKGYVTLDELKAALAAGGSN
jgi:Ca2+-binding EF-hand superfamily protein